MMPELYVSNIQQYNCNAQNE